MPAARASTDCFFACVTEEVGWGKQTNHHTSQSSAKERDVGGHNMRRGPSRAPHLQHALDDGPGPAADRVVQQRPAALVLGPESRASVRQLVEVLRPASPRGPHQSREALPTGACM